MKEGLSRRIKSNEINKNMKRKQFFILVVAIAVLHSGFAQTKPVKIACVGNSITYGAGIENRTQNSCPAQLGALLGQTYEVRNFGVNGATLLQNGNIPYRSTPAYGQALAYCPDWVFIELGANDSKPVNRVFLNEFVRDYKELIASFQHLESRPKVVLLLPLPVFLSDTMSLTAGVVKDHIIPMVRQVAYETGCEVLNLYNLMIESPGLFPDAVHPDAKGAAIIAGRVCENLQLKTEPHSGLISRLPAESAPFNFYGFSGYAFTFRGRDARVVAPRRVASGRPWIWRARFWGHEPQLDIAMLERGFHVVYCDVAEMFGNDEALSIWDDFYRFLHNAGLSRKGVMEGMSRGGVTIYRWAAKFPGRVLAIYADAPVLDLKSWPGGKGSGKGSPSDWKLFQNAFNLATEEEAMVFKGNPLDLAENIARAGFPMLHVVGDADESVPVSENTALFEQRVKAAGGSIEVVHKPGVGHHPHSLPNPQPIVDFILQTN